MQGLAVLTMHCPYMAPQVIKAMGVLLHGAIGASPHDDLPVGLPQVSVSPPAFLGLEGLHVRAEGALILGLIPLGLVRLPQSSGHSRGCQRSVWVKLLLTAKSLSVE